MFNFRFVLRLYADPEMADQDCSKTISPGEALSLAAALSLDGLAVGFGAALGEVNAWAVILCSLATNMLAVMAAPFWATELPGKHRLIAPGSAARC